MNVLFSELPYAAALHLDYLRTRCSNCFVIAHAKCSKCHIAVYCNRKCQSSDWTYHKAECGGLQNGAFTKISSPAMDVDVRLLVRILIRLDIDNGDVDETINFPKDAVVRHLSDLISHCDQFDKNPKNRYFEQIQICVTNYYGLGELWRRHSLDQIKEILGKSQTNVFDIKEDTLDGYLWLGSGLYLNSSRFDHSCDPDIHWSFDGRRINFLKHEASEKKSFDNLKVNYGFSVQPYCVGGILLTSERQKHLIKKYNFICDCSLCADDKLDMRKNYSLKWICNACKVPFCIVGDEKNRIECTQCGCPMNDCPLTTSFILDQLTIAKKHLREANINDVGLLKNAEITKAIKVLQQFAHPIHNIWFCRANLEVFFSSTENIDSIPYILLADTIFVGEKVLKTHELYAPMYDMTMSDVARRLSKLYQKMNNFKRAKEMLLKVRNSFEAKCGSDHVLLKVVDNEIEQLF